MDLLGGIDMADDLLVVDSLGTEHYYKNCQPEEDADGNLTVFGMASEKTSKVPDEIDNVSLIETTKKVQVAVFKHGFLVCYEFGDYSKELDGKLKKHYRRS